MHALHIFLFIQTKLEFMLIGIRTHTQYMHKIIDECDIVNENLW